MRQRPEKVFNDWLAFHRRHPIVFDELEALVFQWRNRGRRHGSIELFFNVLRWERVMAGLPDPWEEWKLNNNYKAFYARFIEVKHPQLDGFFRKRTSIADPYVGLMRRL